MSPLPFTIMATAWTVLAQPMSPGSTGVTEHYYGITSKVEEMAGRDVFILDFSFSPKELSRIADYAQSVTHSTTTLRRTPPQEC